MRSSFSTHSLVVRSLWPCWMAFLSILELLRPRHHSEYFNRVFRMRRVFPQPAKKEWPRLPCTARTVSLTRDMRDERGGRGFKVSGASNPKRRTLNRAFLAHRVRGSMH